MPKLTKKQLLALCSILLLADVVLIKLYVDHIEPYLHMDVTLSTYRIWIIFLNLIVAFIIFLFKSKYALLFLANTIVCGLLITFYWDYYIETHPFSMSEYSFEHDHCNYILHLEKNPDAFDISHVIDSLFLNLLTDREKIYLGIDSTIYLSGYEKKGDSILLHKDFDFETRQYSFMYFYKDTLIGFPEKETKIKVTEIIKE